MIAGKTWPTTLAAIMLVGAPDIAFAQERVEKLVSDLGVALSNHSENLSSKVFADFLVICKTANEEEISLLLEATRKSQGVRLMVFSAFPSPFIVDHNSTSPPYNHELKSEFLAQVRKILADDTAFRGDYVNFYRWTDGLRLPDFSDSIRSSDGVDGAEFDQEVLLIRLGEIYRNAGKLDDAQWIQLVCCAELFSKSDSFDSAAEIRAFIGRIGGWARYRRNEDLSRWEMAGLNETQQAVELPKLRRPSLPLREMSNDELIFLEICISEIQTLSEYRH